MEFKKAIHYFNQLFLKFNVNYDSVKIFGSIQFLLFDMFRVFNSNTIQRHFILCAW